MRQRERTKAHDIDRGDDPEYVGALEEVTECMLRVCGRGQLRERPRRQDGVGRGS
jgi:hypothetical protein